MGSGIWAIFYSLPETGRDDYLSWFHRVHIPEKLSRPGYIWASHFQSFCRQDEGLSEFLALFGGESTRTFFDPSPKQLKERQDEETRRMIDHRVGASSLIYTVEWQIDGTQHGEREAMNDPILWLERFSDTEDPMDLEAWCAQERTRLSGRLQKCRRSRKLLAASGTPRHAVTFEFSEPNLQETGFPLLQEEGSRESRIPEGIKRQEAPFLGTRIWP